MLHRIRIVCALLPLVILAGCGEPSASDLKQLFGPISDLNCVESVGKPGYTCVIAYSDGLSITRSVVKVNDRWETTR